MSGQAASAPPPEAPAVGAPPAGPPPPGSQGGRSNARLNIMTAGASVTVALTLVALKLWALAETRALSIAASLTDSAIDVLASTGGLLALIYSARPADEDHHFGHTSAEDLAALAQAQFILISAGAITWAAFRRLGTDTPPEIQSEGPGMIAMGIAIVLTLSLVLWQRYVARRTGSRVVAADTLNYVGDLIPAVGAIIALWASQRFGAARLDSYVALLTAAVLVFGAVRIGKAAWDALMDRAADPAVVEGIARIAAGWPGVRGYHDLKTRTAGSRLFVHLHIEMDGDQPLREAHDTGAALQRAIIEAYPGADVIIHHDIAGTERGH